MAGGDCGERGYGASQAEVRLQWWAGTAVEGAVKGLGVSQAEVRLLWGANTAMKALCLDGIGIVATTDAHQVLPQRQVAGSDRGAVVVSTLPLHHKRPSPIACMQPAAKGGSNHKCRPSGPLWLKRQSQALRRKAGRPSGRGTGHLCLIEPKQTGLHACLHREDRNTVKLRLFRQHVSPAICTSKGTRKTAALQHKS